MKKVNQKDIENVAQNKEIFLRNKDIDTQRKVMGELKDTRDKLSALEKNVKQKVRGSRPTESSFRNGGLVKQGKPKLAKKDGDNDKKNKKQNCEIICKVFKIKPCVWS
jgi:hypothetical protein